jgi:hypothetical protein
MQIVRILRKTQKTQLHCECDFVPFIYPLVGEAVQRHMPVQK